MKLLVTNSTIISDLLVDQLKLSLMEDIYSNSEYYLLSISKDDFNISINSNGVQIAKIEYQGKNLIFTIQLIKRELYKLVQWILKKPITQIINCCESNHTGQLTFMYFFYSFIKNSNLKSSHIFRLWLNDISPMELINSLDNLKHNDEFISLERRIMIEKMIDSYWIYRMNDISPLHNINFKEMFILKLLSNREQLIKDSKTNLYFKLHVHLLDHSLKGTWSNPSNGDKIKSKEELHALLEYLKDKDLLILSVDEKYSEKEHPLLFNLNDLISEIKKLNIDNDPYALLQELYEEGIITNPNTTSRHLPSNINLVGILSNIKKLSTYKTYIDYIKQHEKIKVTKRVIMDDYIDETHAIIPTTQIPDNYALSIPKYLVYDLIVRRFLSIFMSNYSSYSLNINGCFDENNFVKFSINKEIRLGWMILYVKEVDIQKEIERLTIKEPCLTTSLTTGSFIETENISLVAISNSSRGTSHYTLASLIKLLESRGGNVKKSTKINLRNSGIGLPEERDIIINGLIEKGLIKCDSKGKVMLTVDGEKVSTNIPPHIFSLDALININDKIIQAVQNNYSIEKSLLTHIRDLEEKINEKGIERNYSNIVSKHSCPICRSKLIEADNSIKCSANQCTLFIPKVKSKLLLKESDIECLLTKGATGPIKGFTFKNKPPGTAIAKLCLDSKGITIFDFKN